MPLDLTVSRLHLVLGASLRLRDELLAALLAQWSGPVKRVVEPSDLDRIILDLDTPSLFSDPALWVVRCDGVWLRRQAEVLSRAIGPGVPGGGRIVVVAGALEKGKDALATLVKSLDKTGACHVAEVMGGRELPGWLCGRLGDVPQGVDRPLQVAQALIDHLGEDVDALLGAVEQLAVYCGDKPITVAAVEAVVRGTAERPIWDFTGAILDGNVKRAIELMHAGQGLEPQQALAALIGELRKLIACCESADDGEVAAWIGARGRPNLYYARSRGKAVGRRSLQRLLNGCIQVQRRLRQGGTDSALALEVLVLHAQKVVKPVLR
jgi:DNA polymerase III delta subunit